jgi:energy-coupling factor transport system ATP-binding protein
MLEAVSISHTFHCHTPFSRQALNGVGMKLAAGEVVLLAGPSGGGKTTLARILAGLLPPAQGTVRCNGENLYGDDDKRARASNQVVLACQYPERQFFSNTVWDELSWGLRIGLGMKAADITQRLNRMSSDLAFPLLELAQRSPRSLSFGQQRKAALISLLALEPQVLILDEPLAGLNAEERSRLTSHLRNWINQHRTMLIIAHELDLFLNWVDKVGVMVSGNLAFWGSAVELLQSADSFVRKAITFPPLAQLSYHLKRSGLIDGPVACDEVTVRQQVNEVIEQTSRAKRRKN